MKKIKRIISVILLIVITVVVGYFVYTGSRLTTQNDTGGYYEQIIKDT